MKVKRQMRRLSKADVQFVSLVDRGANRIPFRIVKRDKTQERPMSINLSDPALIFKGEKAPAPAIAAIVTKSEPSAEYLADLKAAGFKTDVKKNDDGTFTLAQGDLPAAGQETLIRAGEETILVMKGFKSWSDALETFSDFLNAKGYYSGVCTATDALRCCLDDILSDVSSPEDASPRVEQALTDFHEYIMTLIKALPKVAFKAESVARKAEVAAASGGVKPMVTTASVAAAGTTEGKGALAPNSDAGYAGGSKALDAKATTGSVAAAGTDSGAATIAPDNKLPNGTSQMESAGAAGNTDKLDAKGTTGAVGSAGTMDEATRVAAGSVAGASSDKKVDPKAAMNEAGLTGMDNLNGMPITVHINVARKADGSLDIEGMQAAAQVATQAALEQVQKQGNAERAKNLEAQNKGGGATTDKQMEPTGKDAQAKNAAASANAGSKVNKDEGAAAPAPAIDVAALTAAVAAAVQPMVEGAVKKLETHLTERVDGIKAQVDSVTQKQGEIATSAADAVAKAEGAAKVLRSTVVGSPLSTETPANTGPARKQAKKGEGDPRTGCFDTAYLRGRGGR